MEIENYYNIGEFALFCNISTRTLRYYDEIGLLTPGHIDEITGYRQYYESQLLMLMVIEGLKLANFSLNSIKTVLSTSDIKTINNIFLKKEDEIDNEIKQLSAIKQKISNRIKSFNIAMEFQKTLKKVEQPQISVKKMPRRDFIFVTKKTPYDIESLTSCFIEIQNLSKKHDIQLIEPYFTIFQDSNFNMKDVHYKFCYCVPEKEDYNLPFVDRLKGGDFACLLHKGRYTGYIENIYNQLNSWANTNKYTIASPLVSVFIAPYAYTKSHDTAISEFQMFLIK
jgi:DNA-binding transcriptional MerR regulator